MKNRSQSTFSLPKIKQVPEQSEDLPLIVKSKRQSLLKEIFRPKWGMVPKCLVKGHEGKQVLYICIHKDCQQTTRLICEQCFYYNHAHHNTECLAIDQIKAASIQKLRYWPFHQQFKKMFQFVTKHESYVNNIFQDVNATFNEMAVRIVNAIDKMRLNMLKKIDTFYIKQTIKKQFAHNLKSQLQDSFDLKGIQKTVSDLFNKKIKHKIFQGKINQILNSEETLTKQKRLLDFFDKSNKGLDIQFDKQSFLKKQDFIIKTIQQQEQSLKNVEVVIGHQKDMQKVIPDALRYLQTAISGFKDLKFQTKTLEDTSLYTGFLCKGLRCVIGMRKYQSGTIYYGQWNNDIREGWGIFENRKTGYRYVGTWKKDRKHGFGRQQTLVTIYQGEFIQDRKQGFGVLIKDGNRYQINWKNDKMHGQGKMIETDGVQSPIYYFNGNQTSTKNQKASGAGMSLTQLAKKYTKSTNTQSIVSQAKST